MYCNVEREVLLIDGAGILVGTRVNCNKKGTSAVHALLLKAFQAAGGVH
jgi:hypothetical protein